MPGFVGMLDTVYRTWGVTATLTPCIGAAVPVAIRVIDETDPTASSFNGVADVHSIVPMARARMHEVSNAGLFPNDLRDAMIVFNGKRWRVDATRSRPSHLGEAVGEIELHLSEIDDE
jgi:hypothetical protein